MKGGKNNKTMKKKKKSLKFLSSLFLGLLMVSGGVLAMPTLDTKTSQAQLQASLGAFEKSPERFLQTQNLGLKNGFEETSVNLKEFSIENEMYSSIKDRELKRLAKE